MNYVVRFLQVIMIMLILISSSSADIIRIGSKKFTENVVLAEILAQKIADQNIETQHRRELGGTRILWNALLGSEIDLYPEYTGTILREILQDRKLAQETDLEPVLKEFGIGISKPLGFNNTYALGMKRVHANALNIETISDLRSHPELTFGFTNEFMDRGDGWPGLQRHYGLPQNNVRGLDHDLAYRGLESGAIDVMDLYSTDAEIQYYDIKTLEDDANYFPSYEAVILFRTDIPAEVRSRITNLEGQIDALQMINLNKQVKIDGESEHIVAARYLENSFGITNRVSETSTISRLWKHTKEHLYLVLISLSGAILISIPLGVVASKFRGAGNIILAIVGIIQTIPSLAVLVFMIPLMGIGGPPAILALFLYSLLPIVRNTYSGIQNIPQPVRESAQVLGLPHIRRLFRIELPMAMPSILAGIKTSAVINVGTATLGALIGAGGYGQPILTGIRLDNMGLILEGAIPAALLAILVQFTFDLTELILVPRGLRL